MTAKLYRLPGGAKKSTAKTSANASGGIRAYQLHVELEWVYPRIWRRLLVPATIDLSRLHVALLWGTGWQGGHLHEFVFADASYGPCEPDWDLPEGVIDESGATLEEALSARRTFLYVYDFGDNWRHKVKVEKTVMLDAPLSLALCLAGENACPPEDVGGAPGYQDFLQALADPAHPEHDELKEWIGRPFDPAAFDVAEINWHDRAPPTGAAQECAVRKAIVLYTARDCNTTWCVGPLELSMRVAAHSMHQSIISCRSGSNRAGLVLCKSKPLFHRDLGLVKRKRASFVRETWMSLILCFQASFDVLVHVEEFVVVQPHGRIGVGGLADRGG